ncbi:MAG: hypothetical protein R3E32_15190 [Chitinophagales bacterium]
MDIRTTLLQKHSKANTMQIVDFIGDDQTRFDELMELLLNGEPLVVQRAAWAVGHCGVTYPRLIHKHFQSMIDKLKQPNIHDAVKRNTVRVWQFVEIPEEFMGSIASICFDYLADVKQAVAIKIFSMTVLLNITQKVPELKNELRLLIEEQMPYGSAGFRSRGRKTLKQLK